MSSEAFPFELDVCVRCECAYRRPDPRQISTMAVRPVLKVRWEATLGGTNKSFGTRKSAYQRYAWKKLAAKYECHGCGAGAEYGPNGEEYGEGRCYRGVCHPMRSNDDYGYTRNPSKNSVMYLQIRFVRWLMWRDAKLRGGQRVTKPKPQRAARRSRNRASEMAGGVLGATEPSTTTTETIPCPK